MFTPREKQKYLDEVYRFREVGNLEGMMNVCRNALLTFPGDRSFIRWFTWAQSTYVHQTLQSSTVQALLRREDFQGLYRLYNKLLDIFPHSKKLNRLLKEVEKKLEIKNSQERNVYFDAARQKIAALASREEWDAAIVACQEVLSYDPSYLPFVRLQSKLEKSKLKYVEEQLKQYFAQKLPELKAEFQQDQSKFICI